MKKIIIFLFTVFMCIVPAFSFEDVTVPYANTKNQVLTPADETKPQLITGAVSLINNVPSGFYGTWKVVSVQVYSNNPFMFNSLSVDYWKLERTVNRTAKIFTEQIQ